MIFSARFLRNERWVYVFFNLKPLSQYCLLEDDSEKKKFLSLKILDWSSIQKYRLHQICYLLIWWEAEKTKERHDLQSKFECQVSPHAVYLEGKPTVFLLSALFGQVLKENRPFKWNVFSRCFRFAFTLNFVCSNFWMWSFFSRNGSLFTVKSDSENYGKLSKNKFRLNWQFF